MKRTPLKRTGWKKKTYQEALEARSQKPYKPLRRTKIRVKGVSTTAENKDVVQGLLRQIVIIRDGGCFLRNYTNEITPQYRECGGYRKDGELILQAEHLHTRSNASSFADSRLVVCCCQRHHIYYKAQHSDEYNSLAKKFIGKERAALWERVKNDHKPHKQDLKLDLLALKQELKTLSTS